MSSSTPGTYDGTVYTPAGSGGTLPLLDAEELAAIEEERVRRAALAAKYGQYDG